MTDVDVAQWIAIVVLGVAVFVLVCRALPAPWDGEEDWEDF